MFAPATPPLLAVIDIATEQIVDADPSVVGIQAIALHGTAPRFKMQVVPETRHLVVSAIGTFADFGGIDVVDLNSLQALGLIVREQFDEGTDIGPIAMMTAERGTFIFSMDTVLSSHLRRFILTNGVEPGQEDQ